MAIDKELTFKLRDEYNRKPIAEKIIKLLESDVDVSPMIIDGGWGTGKSEFCIKLINLLENEDTNLKSVYVDAFKADHADEPLMTLLAAVIKLIPEQEKTIKSKALPVLRFGAKTISKGAVSWLLKQDFADMADDFDDVVQDAGDQIIDKTVASILDDHVKAEESIETLKTALKEITKENPIVIFIDELDRCRPDFAVSMIESIKHIFDVEGVDFVLIVNTDQLKASINHCYGRTVEAKKYLDKFIGLKFHISNIIDINAHEKQYASQQHFSNLIEKSSILEGSFLKDRASKSFSKELISINDLSLREVEKFVKYLEIYHELLDKQGFPKNIIFGFSLLRTLGVFLYCFYQDKIYKNELNIDLIFKTLGVKGIPKYPEDGNYPTHIDTVASMLGIEADLPASEEDLQNWRQTIALYFRGGGISRDRISVVFSVFDVLNLKK